MIVSSCELFQFKIPLTSPIKVLNKLINYRKGLLLCFSDEKGDHGYGEISPLPGLHKETLADVQQNLYSVIPDLLKQNIQEDLGELHGSFKRLFGSQKILSSNRFGLEVSLLNLLAERSQQPLYSLLGKPKTKTVTLNGLLVETKTNEHLNTHALSLIKAGYQTIKLKVGHPRLETDINTLEKLRQVVGPDIQIRLDANQAWSVSEAIRFGKAIREYKIEYIEEPVSSITEIEKFYDQTGIQYALDESLRNLEPEVIPNFKGLNTLVLKPSLLGGLEKTARFCRVADLIGVKNVLSSAFYSGFTLAVLAQFAAVYSQVNTAMGLDTYKWLKEDLLKIPFTAHEAKVEIDYLANHAQDLRLDLLSPLGNI
jgi:O-succinylbenzoate synthase